MLVDIGEYSMNTTFELLLNAMWWHMAHVNIFRLFQIVWTLQQCGWVSSRTDHIGFQMPWVKLEWRMYNKFMLTNSQSGHDVYCMTRHDTYINEGANMTSGMVWCSPMTKLVPHDMIFTAIDFIVHGLILNKAISPTKCFGVMHTHDNGARTSLAHTCTILYVDRLHNTPNFEHWNVFFNAHWNASFGLETKI